jgi:proline/glutamate/leucine-rich protein 1
MSEPERPFLPMSWELGGDLMSGMADSIRERGAREVPGKEGVVEETFDEWEEEWEEEEWEEEEEWPEEEDEWEDEEWKEPLSEKLKTIFKKALGPLVDFVIDTAAIVAIPTVVTLSMITLFRTTDIVEVYLATGAATVITILVSGAKQRLLQRLKQPKF